MRLSSVYAPSKDIVPLVWDKDIRTGTELV